MGKSLIKGSIFGGIIVFIWVMISWMVLPWHCWCLQTFQDQDVVASVLMEQTTVDGIYTIPSYCDHDAEAVKKGPVVFAAIQRFGFDVDSVGPYLVMFILNLIGAFIITLTLLKSAITSYWGRVGLSSLLGLLVGILGSFPNWIWWGYPFGYVLVMTVDLAIAWALAGLAIAAVTKR